MKNLNVIVERKGKSKNNSINVNLTVIWESGVMSKKIKVDQNLLTKMLMKNSSNAWQHIIHKLVDQAII